MKLSTRARYALRLMVQIAKQEDRNIPVSLNQVAREGELPRRYLEQLVIGLKNASLIRGVSGKEGGYCLTKPAGEIKIGAIIESAIGPVNIVGCVNEPRQCLKADVCECRLLWVLINGRIADVLNEFSLADMLDKKWYRLMSQQLTQPHAGPTTRRKSRSTSPSGATQ
ncbi:MAG: Rrf2 family transcriptional regulator [Candidatus Deferrimicrobiaceae bacterium]